MAADKKDSSLSGQSKSPTLFTPRLKAHEVVRENVETPPLSTFLLFHELMSSIGAGLSIASTTEALRNSQVPAEVVPKLADRLKTDQKGMLALLRISESTFYRRRQSGKLSSDEADRIYRYIRLFTFATTMFHGDAGAAREWLGSPAYAFDRKTPLQHASSEIGAHEVETLIGRIAHGIPS